MIKSNSLVLKSSPKVAFFGASVTQQSPGYVDEVKLLISSKCLKFGFGGMHINGAGICFIDEVVKAKPNICFIDWFSTGYANKDGEVLKYIDAIIFKLQKINCRIIFLFLPFRENEEKISFYKELKEFLMLKNMEYICIDEILSSIDKDLLLRDSIHTTPFGSKKYAECIYEYLEKNNKFSFNYFPEKNEYCNLKRLGFKGIINDKFSLKSNSSSKIIGFFHTIGPYTGWIRIQSKDNSEDILLWDRWCYYLRDHFNISCTISDKTDFIILDKDIDVSSCKEKIDFNDFEKKLVVHDIFYIGDKLKLDGKCNRHIMKYYNIFAKKKINNIKHKIKKIIKSILL